MWLKLSRLRTGASKGEVILIQRRPRLGPRFSRLTEIHPAKPSLGLVLSYLSYRLRNTDQDIGDTVLAKTGDHNKRLKILLGARKFDRTDPISIISFFSAYKKLCDKNCVSRGVALVLLPHFFSRESRERFEANSELGEESGGDFSSYPGGMQFFLRM